MEETKKGLEEQFGSYTHSLVPSCLSLGDVSLSAEDKPPSPLAYKVMNQSSQSTNNSVDLEPDNEFQYLAEDGEGEHHHFLEGHTALKFLLAGGVAGAGAYKT